MNLMTLKNLPQYTPTENCLKEKIIVISGAGSGIGRALSLVCAQHGATVVLLGRKLSDLEATYDEIEKMALPQPAIFELDFETATDEHFQALQAALKEEFGRIDTVIHNAAQLGQLKPIQNGSLSEWQRVFQVNVHSTFALTRSLLPLIDNQSAGRIIFTLADTALHGKAFWGAYSAANAARYNFMQTLADELEHTQIRVNGFIPPPTQTKLRAQAYPAESPSQLRQPTDTATQYLYLLDPQQQKENGLVFTVAKND